MILICIKLSWIYGNHICSYIIICEPHIRLDNDHRTYEICIKYMLNVLVSLETKRIAIPLNFRPFVQINNINVMVCMYNNPNIIEIWTNRG